MSLSNFFQDITIIVEEQARENGGARSGYSCGHNGRQTEVALLGGVDVDEGADQTCDGVAAAGTGEERIQYLVTLLEVRIRTGIYD